MTVGFKARVCIVCLTGWVVGWMNARVHIRTNFVLSALICYFCLHDLFAEFTFIFACCFGSCFLSLSLSSVSPSISFIFFGNLTFNLLTLDVGLATILFTTFVRFCRCKMPKICIVNFIEKFISMGRPFSNYDYESEIFWIAKYEIMNFLQAWVTLKLVKDAL